MIGILQVLDPSLFDVQMLEPEDTFAVVVGAVGCAVPTAYAHVATPLVYGETYAGRTLRALLPCGAGGINNLTVAGAFAAGCVAAVTGTVPAPPEPPPPEHALSNAVAGTAIRARIALLDLVIMGVLPARRWSK
jgi:hypothetical protein